MLILFRIVRGFQKYIWLVCLTLLELGFFKVNENSQKSHVILATDCSIELSRSNKAHKYEVSMHPFSLKKSHFGRRLTDKPNMILEFPNNFEQNQNSWILDFFDFFLGWARHIRIILNEILRNRLRNARRTRIWLYSKIGVIFQCRNGFILRGLDRNLVLHDFTTMRCPTYRSDIEKKSYLEAF